MTHQSTSNNTKSAARARRGRVYNTSLRDAQAAQTRQRIIEAFGDEVTGPDADDMTVQRVAARAGVSVPTLYRNFKSLDDLGDAYWAWVEPQVGSLEVIQTADDLPRYAEDLFIQLAARESLVHAMLTSRAGRRLRDRTVGRRNQAFQRALAPLTKGLPPREALAVTAMCKVIGSGHVLLLLRRDWGLEGAEAGRAAAWALHLLIAALKKDSHPFTRRPPTPGRRDPKGSRR